MPRAPRREAKTLAALNHPNSTSYGATSRISCPDTHPPYVPNA